MTVFSDRWAFWAVVGQTEALIRGRTKVQRHNFIWWCHHREFCRWVFDDCDCGLTQALADANEAETGDRWFWERMDAVRTAAGFNDDRARRKFRAECKARGLP